jgi:DNA-binding GntR family transcriptional regulator
MTQMGLATTVEAGRLSLAEKSYQLLVRKITRLEIAPGAVLAEKLLMADLGIGRTPIREALQRLAIEGLVSHQPNRGMFVAAISATSVQHIYEFRALIDRFTARLAALRASEGEIRELAELQLLLVTATDEDDIDSYVELDRRWYLHLRLWFFISRKIGGWHPIARAHEEMTKGVVDALRRRQPEQAEQAMTTYISGRHREIKELL